MSVSLYEKIEAAERLREQALTHERWLMWAVARYYCSLGYKVSMKPARAGNAMVDGVAVTSEGDRIAVEVHQATISYVASDNASKRSPQATAASSS